MVKDKQRVVLVDKPRVGVGTRIILCVFTVNNHATVPRHQKQINPAAGTHRAPLYGCNCGQYVQIPGLSASAPASLLSGVVPYQLCLMPGNSCMSTLYARAYRGQLYAAALNEVSPISRQPRRKEGIL